MFLDVIRKFLGLQSSGFQLVAIYIADSAGEPMKSVPEMQAIKNCGLENDRYCMDKGYWHPVEACQVTLISEHDLKLAQRGSSLEFNQGNHRRNLVISGIKTKQLKGREFSIGEAIFCFDKPRPPCGYLDKIEGQGMAKALSYNSGICLSVIQSGSIKVGDKVVLIDRRKKQWRTDPVQHSA